jgi:preprotein translocase subunit SecF
MDWMRYIKIYFMFSGLMIAVGLFSLLKWGVVLGPDFKGGSVSEYRFDGSISTEEVTKKLEDASIEVSAVQQTQEKTYIFRLPQLNNEDKEKFTKILKEYSGGKAEELRFESVGPTIGPELIKKTVYGVSISAIAILIWIAYQFKSFRFGISAVLAMLHDSFILVGSFSLLGYLLGVEIDFLFVTALLTTLSFSVHDTIVVYDRIREYQIKLGGDLYDLANKAVTETLVRSLNNSFTILFMLTALILLGGSTIKWFAVALFIGTVLGTYSSPFVAVPLLVVWDKVSKLRKPGKDSRLRSGVFGKSVE